MRRVIYRSLPISEKRSCWASTEACILPQLKTLFFSKTYSQVSPKEKIQEYSYLEPKALPLSEVSGSTAQIQWSCETRTSIAVCFTAPKCATSGLCSRSLLGCDSASRSSWCKFSWQNKYSQASRNWSVAQSKPGSLIQGTDNTTVLVSVRLSFQMFCKILWSTYFPGLPSIASHN